MIVGNVLTLALTPGTVSYKAVYGTIVETAFATRLSQYQHKRNQIISKSGSGTKYTPAEGSAEWDRALDAWSLFTLDGSVQSGSQRSMIQQTSVWSSGEYKYYLFSRIFTGVSIWNTASIVGQKVFQIYVNKEHDIDTVAGRIYFATYTDGEGRPSTTMAEVYSAGQPYLLGWNWYTMNPILTMKNRLLVACVPEDLTFRGTGDFWDILEYSGFSNPANYQTRHYTEPA